MNPNTRYKLTFIIQNKLALRKVDKSGKMEKAALEFLHLVNNNSKLTPNQLSFLDAIYENTMKGIGFPSCPTKHDPKKKRF